jgi:hypothetical protein
LNYLKANFLEIPAMTDWKGLCAEVLAFNNGEGPYNFSGLKPYDRDNAAFDAWQDIRQRLKSALAQPEPEGPTVMQILALSDEIEAEELGTIDLVRRALARWGRPAIKPVLVRERPPGPKDCDSEGRCWWLDRPSKNGPAAWILRRPDDGLLIPFLAWLPHYALPVPTSQEAKK